VTATELVAHARRRGITLLAARDRLGLRAPVGVVDAALVDALTQHKPDVLAILAADVLPCPRCARPLDAFEGCWGCPGRLCQACGAWMRARPYSRTCAACQAQRFARLEQERVEQVSADEVNSRLHPCPSCSAQERTKLIPRLWGACAVCEPNWRG
jgi:hypothetical protein